MKTRAYAAISALLFGSVALGHLTRLVYAWPVTIDGWRIPVWVSAPGFVAAAILSVWGFTAAASRRSNPSSPGGTS